MKRLFILFCMLIALAGCGNAGVSDVISDEYPKDFMNGNGNLRDCANWIDILGVIRIPPTWAYTIYDYEPGPFAIGIFGEGVGGSIHMFVWVVMAGDPYMVVNEFSSRQEFIFDDGRSGYMLEGHLFESEIQIVWLQAYLPMAIALSLYYDGNDSVFAENEELILQIARTLTTVYD